jgi:hypothetical protein
MTLYLSEPFKPKPVSVMKYLSLLISIFFTLGLSAQIIDKTEDKAKKKADQRVDRKIDQQLDKGLDAIEGLFSKKKKKKDDADEKESTNSPSSNNMGSIMGMMGSEEIDRTYEFDHNFRLKIESYKKDKLDSEMTMKMYMSEETSTMGVKMEGEEAKQLDFMVFDMKEQEMLSMMNNDGQKMGIRIETDPPSEEEAVDQSMPQVRFEKTGNSKTISGFSCDEYQIIYESKTEDQSEGEQYFWITDEAETDWIKSMTKMAAHSPNMPVNYDVPDSYPEGSVIQMVQYDEDKKEKSVITVLEMNMDDSYSFSTKGYSFMNMPSSGGGYPGMK